MKILGRIHRKPKKQSGGVLPLVLTAFMLAMALVPMTQPGSASADEKPKLNIDLKKTNGPILIDIKPTETPIVIDVIPEYQTEDRDDSVDIPIDIPDDIVVVPTETPVIEPDFDIITTDDLDVTATAPNGGSAVVYVNKHGCPSGYDNSGKSFYDLAYDCHDGSDGVEFGLSDGGGFVQWQSTGDVVANGVQFDGIPVGAYSILEQVPAGFGAPRVFCDAKLFGEQGQPANFVEESVADGNQIFHVLQADEFYYCDWFNFPSSTNDAGDGAGTISIFKGECPIGFDSAAADVYDFAYYCGEPLANVNFLLSDGNGAIATDISDSNGSIGFIDVPAIPVSIVEQVPSGYGEPVVFCISNVPGDNQPGPTVQQQVLDGNQIFHLMKDQESLSCTWYNVPSLSTDAGDGEGTISIFKGECPVGFDASTADVYDFAFYCNEPMESVTFLLSDGASAIGVSVTDDQGIAGFNGVEAIPVSIVEQVPAGYSEPVVFCISNVPGDNQVGDTVQQQVLDGNQIFHLMQDQESLSCTWYNIPTDDGGEVIVYKYECDSAPGTANDMTGHLESEGCETVDGIDFTLSYGIDTMLPGTTGANEGAVHWTGLPSTDVFITESVPAGFGEPVVYCSSEYPGNPTPDTYIEFGASDGTIGTTLNANATLTCWWINIPEYDGEVVVIKHTCEAGYDLFGDNADPSKDCKTRTNGIEFDLEDENGYWATGVTGDSGDNGKTIFEDLEPGAYVLSEVVPTDTQQVFVLNCEDKNYPYIQGYPLALDSTLNLNVESDSRIVCHWYNVPAHHDGSIEVTKYACPTEYFVHASYCEIYEGGVGFNLSTKQGSQWFDVAKGTTNSAGKLKFTNLSDGTYSIDEIGSAWCYAEADRTDSKGYLVVEPGKVTRMSVWNCGIGNIVKQPNKFPNTGVSPVEHVSTGQYAPVATAGQTILSPFRWSGVFDERLVAFLNRTERPVEVRIGSVGLVAGTETLEIVDGALQDPTTADKVAWYKDSAGLGTQGNVVMAGHLNYWGIPEGVFYNLTSVSVGDDIVVMGDHGNVFQYRVTWVEQVDSQSSELNDIVGSTDTPSLTLITCGGEWDPQAREYNERTVVRAEFVTEVG